MKNKFVRVKKEVHHSEASGIREGYEVEGFLIDEPIIGQPLYLFRTKRNGEKVPGLFTTSPVLNIEQNLYGTLNSIYKIEEIESEEEDERAFNSWKNFPL